MKMVGHKTESIYRRYAIVDADSLREAARKIDAVVTLTVTPAEKAPPAGALKVVGKQGLSH